MGYYSAAGSGRHDVGFDPNAKLQLLMNVDAVALQAAKLDVAVSQITETCEHSLFDSALRDVQGKRFRVPGCSPTLPTVIIGDKMRMTEDRWATTFRLLVRCQRELVLLTENYEDQHGYERCCNFCRVNSCLLLSGYLKAYKQFEVTFGKRRYLCLTRLVDYFLTAEYLATCNPRKWVASFYSPAAANRLSVSRRDAREEAAIMVRETKDAVVSSLAYLPWLRKEVVNTPAGKCLRFDTAWRDDSLR